jgi:hypothetical protein
MTRQWILLGSVVLALFARTASAQVDVCRPGEGIDQEKFQLMLLRVADIPEAAPADKQLSAAANSSTSPDIVSSPNSTSLLAMAVDSGFISQASGATTLNLNSFAFIAALRPRVVEEQELYERFTTARRLSGTVTIGGKGDSFDQDGNGTVDDAQTADNATDNMAWEIRLRVYGSHDRRDRHNYAKFRAGLGTANATQLAQLGAFAQAYGTLHPDQSTAKFFCHPDVAKFVADPGNRAAVDQFVAREASLKASFDAIAAEIDTSMLVTIVAGGVERRDDTLGPDKRLYGVRASYGLKDMTFDANLEYNKIKSFHGAEDQSSTKLGLAYNATYLKDLLGYEDHGITVTLSAVYEKYRDVPDTAHDEIAKANIKLTYPLSETVNLLFSTTWANHTDLLDAEKEIRGNIGFTYDLGPLFKPAS